MSSLKIGFLFVLSIAVLCKAVNIPSEVVDDELELEPAELEETIFHKHYHAGVAGTHDILVYFKHKTNKSWRAKNYKAVFHYPSSRKLKISHWYAEVNQTSDRGHVDVKHGGIGHLGITLEIHAEKTKKFDYSVKIYANHQ